MSHFQTLACFGSKVLALTWKRFFLPAHVFTSSPPSVFERSREHEAQQCRSHVLSGYSFHVAFAANYFNALKTALSSVEVLILECWRADVSSEWRNEADRTQWRDLLRPLSNLKTLQMCPWLVDQLSHSLQSDDGESPVELLPELKEITHSSLPLPDTATFTGFIDARRIAGRPVTVVRRSTRFP